ncbi:MAG: DUF3429 domain-containing protein [Pseudomonadota bacterium]
MTRIPAAPLILGLAGLIPFLWAAATHLSPALATAGGAYMPPMFIGKYVGLTYGSLILSFMSGVLWGFATRATGQEAAVGYALSVIPALWCFFMVTDASAESLLSLAAGFAGLLALDYSFARQGLTPAWWMPLRLLLTAIVLACLGVLMSGS